MFEIGKARAVQLRLVEDMNTSCGFSHRIILSPMVKRAR